MVVIDDGYEFEFACIGRSGAGPGGVEFVGADAEVNGVIAVALLAELCIEVISSICRLVAGVFVFVSCRCCTGIEDNLGWLNCAHTHGGLEGWAEARRVVQDGKRRRVLGLRLNALDGSVVRTAKVAVAILKA